MSMAAVVFRKVCGLLHSLLACFRRLLCCFGRRRSNIGELPMSVVSTGAAPSFQPHYPDAPRGGAQWGEWSDNRIGDTVEDKISDYRTRVAAENERRRTSEEGPKEADLFSDLAPAIRKTKKVVLRPREAAPAAQRFGLASSDAFIPDTGAELGDIAETEDAGSWDFDDDDLDVSGVVKEARRKEHQERMQKRDAQRAQKQSSIAAVKISM